VRLVFDMSPELKGVQLALGGGPTLVRDGKAMSWSNFQVRHPRTALGWNSNTLFLVVVDGRQAGLSVGMTFPELANYMAGLGCDEAVNLDGGGSASMWVLGQVVNSPSEGRERPGANSLVLVRRPAHAGKGAVDGPMPPAAVPGP
jgi:exopolysaccharide biosynthesis protein